MEDISTKLAGGGIVQTSLSEPANESGKVATFADLYGLDNKLATALFGDANGFPVPPPQAKRSSGQVADASVSRKQTAGGNDLAGSLQGFFGD